MDWNGGTYLSQVSGINLDNAISKWIDGFSFSEIGVDDVDKNEFVDCVNNEIAEPINGLKNVWCISPDIGDVMAIVHIICTSSDPI